MKVISQLLIVAFVVITVTNASTVFAAKQPKLPKCTAIYSSVSNDRGMLWAPAIIPSDNFTVETWIKAEDFKESYSTHHYIFSQASSNSGVEFSLSLAGSATLFEGKEGYLQLYFWDETGPKSMFINTVTVSTNEWHHVAITRGNNLVRLFLDGNVVGEMAYTGLVTYATNGLAISAYASNSDYAHDRFFGLVDEYRVSKVVRYTGNFTPKSEQFGVDKNTVMLLHLNKSSKDATKNNNDAVIVNGLKYSADSAVTCK